MLRRASTDAYDALLRAARGSDRDLDWSLLRVGVLAPADLTPIRVLLGRPDTGLRPGARGDGHCLIEVTQQGERVAYLHHDGTIETASRFEPEYAA